MQGKLQTARGGGHSVQVHVGFIPMYCLIWERMVGMAKSGMTQQ
jgi:hypothetical protein